MQLFDYILPMRVRSVELKLIEKAVRQHDFNSCGHFVRCAVAKELRRIFPKEMDRINFVGFNRRVRTKVKQ
jgi:hypothetical protein